MTPAPQVDCPLRGSADNEDNTEVVILCLNGQVVIKVQIRAELMFHFCRWCERHNRLRGWSAAHIRLSSIWHCVRRDARTHQPYAILRCKCFGTLFHSDARLILHIWNVSNSLEWCHLHKKTCAHMSAEFFMVIIVFSQCSSLRYYTSLCKAS